MNYEILNSKFSDIYVLRLIRSGGADDIILEKIGTSCFDDPDFIETNFKYTQGKTEFGDPDIMNYLDYEDKSEVDLGGGVMAAEKTFRTLFPSVSAYGDYGSGIKYFSTKTSAEGDETYCILVPEGVTTIFTSTHDISEPDIKITFNSSEVGFSKVLTIVTSRGSVSPRSLNLSWMAYQGDKNGNREMPNYLLRNDSLVENYYGYKIDNGYIYSEISSSLLGTSKIGALTKPIYTMKKSRLGDGWNRAKRYSIGDTARVGDTVFESIEPNNIGNHPYYSKMWIKI